jgi:hypothetical protein
LTTDGRCVLATIAYLERNDFTRICQVTDTVIMAMDGNRHVYVLLVGTGLLDVSIPIELVKLAKHDHARIDVIDITVTGDLAQLKHMMNAVPA